MVFGDKGYVSDKRKRASRADGVLWAVKDKRKPGRVLSASQKKRNRKHGSVRAKVEHIFRVIKCQFGYRMRIPGRSGHPYRWHPATHSDLIRPGIPVLSGHFRPKFTWFKLLRGDL